MFQDVAEFLHAGIFTLLYSGLARDGDSINSVSIQSGDFSKTDICSSQSTEKETLLMDMFLPFYWF